MKSSYVFGVDVSFPNIVVSIAERDENKIPKIIGFGSSPSEGFRNGEVVHFSNASRSIEKALLDARRNTGVEDEGEVVLSFDSINSLNLVSSGTVSLTARGRNITRDDESRAVAAAYRTVIKGLPSEYIVIHAFPVSSTVDGKGEIADPFGMFGSVLSSEILFIAVPFTTLLNVANCVTEHVGAISGIVYRPFANSLGILRREDFISLENNIFAHVNIGQKRSTLSVFCGDAPLRLASIDTGFENLAHNFANHYENMSLESSFSIIRSIGRRGVSQPVQDPSEIDQLGNTLEETAFETFSSLASHIYDISSEHLTGGIFVSGEVESSSPFIMEGFSRAFNGYASRVVSCSPEHPLAMFYLSKETSIEEQCDFAASAGAVHYLYSIEQNEIGSFDPSPETILGKKLFTSSVSANRKIVRPLSPFSQNGIVKMFKNAVKELL